MGGIFWGLASGTGKRFFLVENVKTGFGAQTASYSLGNGGSFPGVKVGGVWSLTPTYM
jgi:hypothetical protein